MKRNSPYTWMVVQDPTRVGFDPGLYYGNLFRLSDIQVTDCWPDGMVFRHTGTGEEIVIVQGRFVRKGEPQCPESL